MERAAQPRQLLQLLIAVVASLSVFVSAQQDGMTIKHEQGRCAIRGECGKQSIFGKQLPCPDNGLAQNPMAETRKKLVQICGDKWSEGAICCDDDQV